MIDQYIIVIWIGLLSFVMIFCTIMDMVTVSKEGITVVTKKDDNQYSHIPSHSDDYEDINMMYEEDNNTLQGD